MSMERCSHSNSCQWWLCWQHWKKSDGLVDFHFVAAAVIQTFKKTVKHTNIFVDRRISPLSIKSHGLPLFAQSSWNIVDVPVFLQFWRTYCPCFCLKVVIKSSLLIFKRQMTKRSHLKINLVAVHEDFNSVTRSYSADMRESGI